MQDLKKCSLAFFKLLYHSTLTETMVVAIGLQEGSCGCCINLNRFQYEKITDSEFHYIIYMAWVNSNRNPLGGKKRNYNPCYNPIQSQSQHLPSWNGDYGSASQFDGWLVPSTLFFSRGWPLLNACYVTQTSLLDFEKFPDSIPSLPFSCHFLCFVESEIH